MFSLLEKIPKPLLLTSNHCMLSPRHLFFLVFETALLLGNQKLINLKISEKFEVIGNYGNGSIEMILKNQICDL